MTHFNPQLMSLLKPQLLFGASTGVKQVNMPQQSLLPSSSVRFSGDSAGNDGDSAEDIFELTQFDTSAEAIYRERVETMTFPECLDTIFPLEDLEGFDTTRFLADVLDVDLPDSSLFNNDVEEDGEYSFIKPLYPEGNIAVRRELIKWMRENPGMLESSDVLLLIASLVLSDPKNLLFEGPDKQLNREIYEDAVSSQIEALDLLVDHAPLHTQELLDILEAALYNNTSMLSMVFTKAPLGEESPEINLNEDPESISDAFGVFTMTDYFDEVLGQTELKKEEMFDATTQILIAEIKMSLTVLDKLGSEQFRRGDVKKLIRHYFDVFPDFNERFDLLKLDSIKEKMLTLDNFLDELDEEDTADIGQAVTELFTETDAPDLKDLLADFDELDEKLGGNTPLTEDDAVWGSNDEE